MRLWIREEVLWEVMMSIIINFKKKRISAPRFFSQTQQYWNELEDKRMLISALILNYSPQSGE